MKIIFAGTPDFAVPTLRMLLASEHRICAVYTQPDRPAGRGRQLKPSPVKEVALTAGVPVYQPENLKSDEEQQRLRDFAADLMVVVAYGVILPSPVLAVPRFGCINIHASLLPRWRGAAPIQRALLAGDKETGVTIMQIAQQLDAGDMLHKEVYVIESDDTAAMLFEKLAHLGAAGLAKVLPAVETGRIIAKPQDEALVTYAAKLDKSEASIAWQETAETLARKIRAFNPWPVAQTNFGGVTLRIWKARVLSEPCDRPPGTVRYSNGKHLDVATGKGFLRLQEVQLPGGRRIPAHAFINAHSVDGMRFGTTLA
ncbi:MAG: methionyl-tRNA formyltransferase [Gammaproteobacteria bacterium]